MSGYDQANDHAIYVREILEGTEVSVLTVGMIAAYAMEDPSSFHLILLHLHNPQSITRYFQHHYPHKYHYWICDPQGCGCYSSISYILPIELEVS